LKDTSMLRDVISFHTGRGIDGNVHDSSLTEINVPSGL
jgi:hypothetical protein